MSHDFTLDRAHTARASRVAVTIVHAHDACARFDGEQRRSYAPVQPI